MNNGVKKLLVEIALSGVSLGCYADINLIINILKKDFKYREVILTIEALCLYKRECFTEVVNLIQPHIGIFPDLIFLCILSSEKLNNKFDTENFLELAIKSSSINAQQFAKEFQVQK